MFCAQRSAQRQTRADHMWYIWTSTTDSRSAGHSPAFAASPSPLCSDSERDFAHFAQRLPKPSALGSTKPLATPVQTAMSNPT
eukprot:6194003-Pleurochrysis_carterae.AAC.1